MQVRWVLAGPDVTGVAAGLSQRVQDSARCRTDSYACGSIAAAEATEVPRQARYLTVPKTGLLLIVFGSAPHLTSPAGTIWS